MSIGGFGTGIALVLYPGIAEILPNRYRSIGLGWTKFNLVPMSIFSSLAGHALAQNATWRWVSEYASHYDARLIWSRSFIIGGITAVICLVGTAIFYYPPPRPHAISHIPRMQLVRELDYIGVFQPPIFDLSRSNLIFRLLSLHRRTHRSSCWTLSGWQYSRLASSERHRPNRLWRCGLHRLLRLRIRWHSQAASIPPIYFRQVTRVHVSDRVSILSLCSIRL